VSKKAARATRTKPPALPVKPLRRLGARVLEHVRSLEHHMDWKGHGDFARRRRTNVDGVRLPTDLCAAAWVYAYAEFRDNYGDLTGEEWTPLEDEFGRQFESLTGTCREWCTDYGPVPTSWKEVAVSEEGWLCILRGMELCFRRGFYLALLRYADDLKHVPEVAAIHKRLAHGRKRGAAATKKKAEPTRKAIQEQFRQLRREGFAPDLARQKISQDSTDPKTGMPRRGFSVRNIERYT
jgi:hypothetical protein